MKFFIKLLLKAGVTLGVMFIAYQYLLPGMGSSLLGNMGGGILPSLNDTSEKATKGLSDLGNAVVKEDVRVYQWTDEAGITHFGSTPPVGAQNVQTKDLRADTNLMKAVKPREQESEEGDSLVSRVLSIGDSGGDSGDTKSKDKESDDDFPSNIKDMMQKSHELKDQINERSKQQEQLMKDLMKLQK